MTRTKFKSKGLATVDYDHKTETIQYGPSSTREPLCITGMFTLLHMLRNKAKRKALDYDIDQVLDDD